jgi:signal transduction histidine kinase
LFNIAVGWWGFFAFFVGMESHPEKALFLLRLSLVGTIFIPVFHFHLVCLLCGISRRTILFLIYSQGIIFLLLSQTEYLVAGVKLIFSSFYYTKPAFLYHSFLFIWLTIVIYGHYELLRFFLISDRRKKQQIFYLFFGTIVGFSGGVTNFLPVYGINIYPFGNFMIAIYCVIVSYAIIQHRLMDITVVVTRTGIFIAVYSFVLGIPFALAFGWREQLQRFIGEMWWIVPPVVSTVLATVGPFVYFYIQKKAEDRFLQEQRRYQTALRRASLGMGRIKDLHRLLNLTVYIVTRTVRIEHCIIYLFHGESNSYVLRAAKGIQIQKEPHSAVRADSALVEYIKRKRDPLVYDEIKQLSQEYNDGIFDKICADIENLRAAIVVPSFVEESLIAIIVMGRKISGELYSQDDLIVFSILGNQVGLAIENAQFYEDMKNTHEQLIMAEKMATIGTMADGLSHQINNRLHAMGFIAGDALDTLKLKRRETMPEETRQLLAEVEYALDKIQDNVKRGGEIVEGLLKYSRKADEGFSVVELDNLVDSSLEMAQFKMRLGQIDIVRNFNHGTPGIRGNFTQLQEVLFNIIDNSYDAMMQRKDDLKEAGYRGRIEIGAHGAGKNLEIVIEDNGMGVREQDIRKLFTPFFTTKLSSKKGTGLGLYVMRKIIEENHGGKVEFTSEYQKGSRTKLLLPVAA